MTEPAKNRKWANRMLASGLCVRCGKAREHYMRTCDACAKKDTARTRKRTGSKVWRPGGPGRPPKVERDDMAEQKPKVGE